MKFSHGPWDIKRGPDFLFSSVLFQYRHSIFDPDPSRDLIRHPAWGLPLGHSYCSSTFGSHYVRIFPCPSANFFLIVSAWCRPGPTSITFSRCYLVFVPHFSFSRLRCLQLLVDQTTPTNIVLSDLIPPLRESSRQLKSPSTPESFRWYRSR